MFCGVVVDGCQKGGMGRWMMGWMEGCAHVVIIWFWQPKICLCSQQIKIFSIGNSLFLGRYSTAQQDFPWHNHLIVNYDFHSHPRPCKKSCCHSRSQNFKSCTSLSHSQLQHDSSHWFELSSSQDKNNTKAIWAPARRTLTGGTTFKVFPLKFRQFSVPRFTKNPEWRDKPWLISTISN